MENIILIFKFIIGTCLGSHALVITQRLNKENFIWGSSHCDNCQMNLSLLDEIPIYSFLKNKGRCKFCKESIPIVTIVSEILGGFTFFKINFYSFYAILDIIFLFYLLVIALQDFQDQEFSTIFLIPISLITFLSPLSAFYNFELLDWIVLIFLALFFVLEISKSKMGFGDLIIFIFLGLYLGSLVAVHILLLGCILFLIYYLLNPNSHSLAFIPFILGGLIINNLN
ncbi:leader peptidase (prepilin peptidase)/N-methyltransferase [Lactobacillus colini]|uniref:Leader peptidase (Prepilin peptidase)/N-methyltransferase n=1 Tax=Lactobacillus colini TaxID=1819254 RepID=A0ABS4MC85_9LACO|nr:prepilin peptidase [Lactobacillus colini]MBP2057266.1 leader peptidase (prepilin peptidase)/N-methyltransferase [Lactobacillus colini]